MGLDLAEFQLAVEEAFEFRFPDQDLPTITTPGRLITYLVAHLPPAAANICLSQRVFYRLRSAVAARVGCSRSELRPDTPLLALIPSSAWTTTWERVGKDVFAGKSRHWPRLDEPRWFDLFRRPRIGTLREATRLIVAYLPRVAKDRETGWTQSQVAEVVHGLIHAQLGYQRHEYTDDSRWDKDMGIY